ncbi:MAG TPA: YlbF family regulator [Bacillota bacterium]|nr:YlbF family regulator [Bacillota bacterium]HQC36576.1 YlbF family regulator [Bacillota bacterium]
MQNVYDIAHELVRSLKETDQYKNYKELKAKIDGNPELVKMINDFQEKNMQMQLSVMQGVEVDEELKQQIGSLYGIVMGDPLAAQYMQAEFSFTQVVSEIYGIIGEVAKE